MFKVEALQAAVALVTAQHMAGITLGTVADSPLSVLTRNSPTTTMVAEETDFNTLIERLVEFSKTQEHASTLAEIRTLAANAVRGSINVTRNVVLPHLRSVIDMHTTRMAETADGVMPFKVDVKYTPEVYKSNVAVQFIERWDNVPPAPLAPPIKLGQYSVDEIRTLAMLTDDGSFNDDMADLLGSADGIALSQITSVLAGTMAVQNMDPQYSLPMAIILENITTPKEGVEMTLSQYNASRVAMGNTAARTASSLMRTLDNNVRVGSLYSGLVQKDANVITVTGEVYRTMVTEGLDVEMLIGNELLGRKFTGQQLLDPANQAEMTSAYERDRGVRQQANLLNTRTRSRQLILDVLRDDHARIASLGEYPVEGDTAEKSWMRIRDITNKVMGTQASEMDASLVISAILIAVWYGHTDSGRVIDIMFDVERTNEGLSPSEIATLAHMRYIAEWTASMIIKVTDASQLEEQF